MSARLKKTLLTVLLIFCTFAVHPAFAQEDVVSAAKEKLLLEEYDFLLGSISSGTLLSNLQKHIKSQIKRHMPAVCKKGCGIAGVLKTLKNLKISSCWMKN